jgi:hypothetical protein
MIHYTLWKNNPTSDKNNPTSYKVIQYDYPQYMESPKNSCSAKTPPSWAFWLPPRGQPGPWCFPENEDVETSMDWWEMMVFTSSFP